MLGHTFSHNGHTRLCIFPIGDEHLIKRKRNPAEKTIENLMVIMGIVLVLKEAIMVSTGM